MKAYLMFNKGDLLQSNNGNFQVLVMSVGEKHYSLSNASDFTPDAEWQHNVSKVDVERTYALADVQGKVKIKDRQLPYFKARKKLTHT